MPRFQVDIEKVLEGEYWTNRYIVDAADLEVATTHAQGLYDAERAVHLENVMFTKFRVSDMVPLTDVYQIINLNTFGMDAIGGVHFLPLFNVVRVDLNTFGGGRPSRKYLRLPIREDRQTNGILDLAYRNFVAANYIGPLLAVGQFRDVDGQAFSGGTVFPRVGMRQLRRGTKRKTQPILP